MPTRDQITDERVRELIKKLGNEGIIDKDESEKLVQTRSFGEAAEVCQKSSQYPSVTRSKVTTETHEKFAEAYNSDNTNRALAIIWEVLTGVDVSEDN